MSYFQFTIYRLSEINECCILFKENEKESGYLKWKVANSSFPLDHPILFFQSDLLQMFS
jgi:hypothetical protein